MSETTSVVSLKSLLVPTKTVETEFPGLPGFKLSIAFLSREQLVAIRKKATKTEFKNRQPTESFNEELFLQLYVEACIKGWEGLTFAYLEQLAPVDVSMYKPEDQLGFSKENALYLMKASTEFDAFISDTVTDLSNFQKTSGA